VEEEMLLTTETLQRFVGGQMEIQNQIEQYLFRGEIARISVQGENLEVQFAWFAKGEGYPRLPYRWVNDENLSYSLTLLQGFTSVSDIGPGPKGGGSRINITSIVSNEMIVLYPPGGSKLNPTRVEGLGQVARQT
jgi:hypothetical protein